jgi:YidC/Oxa1 family membrane protein insertase
LKALVTTILYQPLFNALIFLVWLMPWHSVGLAIIVLTVVVRIILLPSSLNAARQQKRMRDLQPQIQKLQDKHKDDKQAQSQALMEFYRKEKINPLGSCLPLLIQFPILIVLYYVFIHGLNFDSFNLLYSFTPRPDVMNTMFLGIDLAKPERWILPVLAGVLQFIQGWQITPHTKAQEGGEMANMISKQMLYLMPVFTIFIAGRFPAALPLYWIITTLFAIGQQWWVFREKKDDTQKGEKPKESLVSRLTSHKTPKGVEVTVRKKAR